MQWLPPAILERRELYIFQSELQNSCESETEFVTNEFRVKITYLICLYLKGVAIKVFKCRDCAITPEYASRSVA